MGAMPAPLTGDVKAPPASAEHRLVRRRQTTGFLPTALFYRDRKQQEETRRGGRATHQPSRAPSRPTSSASSQATSPVTPEERRETREHRTAPCPARPCPPRPVPALTEAGEEPEPPLLLRAQVQRVRQHRPAPAALEHGAVLGTQPPAPQRSLPWGWGWGRGRGRRRWRGGGGRRGPLRRDDAAEQRLLQQAPPHRHLLPPGAPARRPALPASRLERARGTRAAIGRPACQSSLLGKGGPAPAQVAPERV